MPIKHRHITENTLKVVSCTSVSVRTCVSLHNPIGFNQQREQEVESVGADISAFWSSITPLPYCNEEDSIDCLSCIIPRPTPAKVSFKFVLFLALVSK